MKFEEFLPVFKEFYPRATLIYLKEWGRHLSFPLTLDSYELTLDFLVETFKKENPEVDTEIIKDYIIKACDKMESYRENDSPIIRINNIKPQEPIKMRMFLNVERRAWMRPLFIQERGKGEYSIHVKAESIKLSILRYIQYMVNKHGGPYIGFINVHGTQELRKIIETRFINEAYLYSIHLNDDDSFTSTPVRNGIMKRAYFDMFRHFFEPKPKITKPTEEDLEIAGDLKEKILISSFERRVTEIIL